MEGNIAPSVASCNELFASQSSDTGCVDNKNNLICELATQNKN